jgi:hypothetical protein
MQTRNAWLNNEPTQAATWVQASNGDDTWTWSTTVNGAPTQFVFTFAQCASAPVPTPPTQAPPPPAPVLHRACLSRNGFYYDLRSDSATTTFDKYQGSTLLNRQNYGPFTVPTPGSTTWDEGVGFAATMQTRNAWLNNEPTQAATWVQAANGDDTWTWSTTVNGAPTQFVFARSNCV